MINKTSNQSLTPHAQSNAASNHNAQQHSTQQLHTDQTHTHLWRNTINTTQQTISARQPNNQSRHQHTISKPTTSWAHDETAAPQHSYTSLTIQHTAPAIRNRHNRAQNNNTPQQQINTHHSIKTISSCTHQRTQPPT